MNKKLRYREEHSASVVLIGVLNDIYRETIYDNRETINRRTNGRTDEQTESPALVQRSALRAMRTRCKNHYLSLRVGITMGILLTINFESQVIRLFELEFTRYARRRDRQTDRQTGGLQHLTGPHRDSPS